jgi:hypothetical protein
MHRQPVAGSLGSAFRQPAVVKLGQVTDCAHGGTNAGLNDGGPAPVGSLAGQ